MKPFNTLINISAYFVIYVLWGANFIAIYFAIETIPPFLMVGNRFLLAGLLLFGFCFLKKIKTPKLSLTLIAVKQGLWLNVGGTGALVWSEQYIPSGLASIIIATVPLWMVIMDKKNWESYLSNIYIIIGLIAGLSGVILISNLGGSSGLNGNNFNFYWGLIILFIGTLCWSYGSLCYKNIKSDFSLVMNLSIQMISAGLILLIIGCSLGELRVFSFKDVSVNSIAGLTYLIFVGSIIGYLSYIWLLRNRPVAEVGTYTLVNPVVAIILGIFIVHEKITLKMVISILLILLSLFLITYNQKIRIIISRFYSFKN